MSQTYRRQHCVAVVLFATMTAACGTSPTKAAPASDSGLTAEDSGGGSDAGGPRTDAADTFAEAGTVSISRDGGTPISPFAFGQNYWDWIDWANSGVTGLTGTETLVNALHLNVLRAGGNNNDSNSPQPFDSAQIDKYVAYCRSVGAEPILQVPLIANPDDGGTTSPATAAAMVTYANVTKGYGIRYWEIGNEPDVYQSTYDSGVPLTATDYCSVYSSYAAAMRTANSAAGDGGTALQFVGPDLAWKYVPGNDWLTPFLDGCKNDVDIVSVHRYPFSATQISTSGDLADNASFRAAISAVQTIVRGHARPGTPLAVTESNVSYDYDATKYSAAAVTAAPGSFYAALWTADALGVALENHLWTLALWNLGESDRAGSILGYVVGQEPVPAYYGEELVSANFRGNTVVPTGVPAGFSVYASHDVASSMSAVLVINKGAAGKSLTLLLDGVSSPSLGFPALSISLVKIPDAVTAAPHVWRYTADLAAAGLPPSEVE